MTHGDVEAELHTARVVLADEEAHLWHDLYADLREAIGTPWSMACGARARRIARMARLVGATHAQLVPWPLVAGEVYEAILTVGGIAPVGVPPTAEEWQRVDDLQRQALGHTRDEYRGMYAAAVAAITTDLTEADFILAAE